jgi:hypothetical protein
MRKASGPNLVNFHPTMENEMRKLILIAAVALASTAANAGPSRGLSVTSADATQPVMEHPKTQTPDTTADKPAEVMKPKRAHVSTEARVIYELHRHGIYW